MTAQDENCAEAVLVASYVLGALEPADRVRVAAHLPGCRTCRESMELVAGLPGLLARVSAAEAAAGPPVPDEAMLRRLEAAARAERRNHRRRLAAAAATVALLATAAVTLVAQNGRSDPPGTTISGAQGPVHASVRLIPTSGGTDLRLALSGVAPEQTCRLVAVADDGHREVAASWKASYSGTAHLRGSTALPPARIASLRIETFDEQTLVTLPLPAPGS